MDKNNISKTSYTIDELLNINLEIKDDEIFDNLERKDCHDFLKIFSILNIKKIDSDNQAQILLFHLTDHSNPIREMSAIKLEEVVLMNDEFFINEYAIKQFSKGLIDINPNICRAICNIIQNSKNIKEKIEPLIIEDIEILIKNIKEYEITHNDKFSDNCINRKNHAKNKKLFSLYWLLEGLSICLSKKYNSQALEIINYTINFTDYTIREKTAKILAIIENPPHELLQKAKNDQNFYVKNIVCDKMNFEE